MSFEELRLDRRRHGPSRPRRALEAAATTVVWIVYLCLWAPAVVTGLSLLRIRVDWLEQLHPIGADELVVLARVGGAAAALGLALLLWARNEQRRFRGRERRRRCVDVSRDELVRGLHADPGAAAILQQVQVGAIHHRPDGSLAAVSPQMLLPPEIYDPVAAIPCSSGRTNTVECHPGETPRGVAVA